MDSEGSDYLNYQVIVDQAMRKIAKDVLLTIKKYGIIGDHHFLISFLTDYEGVILSNRIKQKYPKEMTIILQYEFQKLEIHEDFFSVVLSFDSIPEKIVIPFYSLTSFIDPSTSFALQFNPDLYKNKSEINKFEKVKREENISKTKNKTISSDYESDNGKVIVLDMFRK